MLHDVLLFGGLAMFFGAELFLCVFFGLEMLPRRWFRRQLAAIRAEEASAQRAALKADGVKGVE